MPRVSKRGGFSDRNGIKPESVEIQLKKFDQRTRIQLQNLISELYGDIYSEELKYGYSGRNTQNFFKFSSFQKLHFSFHILQSDFKNEH